MELTHHLNSVYGWTAAGLTLLAFCCTHIVRLRWMALGANMAFIAYGFSAELWPVLALHTTLVPINLWRLRQALRSVAPGARPGAAPEQPRWHPMAVRDEAGQAMDQPRL